MKDRFIYASHMESEVYPQTAALLSLLPGLGQLYNGQGRKGILFLNVAVINLAILTVIFFTQFYLQLLNLVMHQFQLQPNTSLLRALESAHIGTPASIIFLGLVLSFVAYAMRDAFEHYIRLRRRRIYPECAMEMDEATSGSYLFHFSLMGCCLILALFFLLPAKPKMQVTDIEFITAQQSTKQVTKTATRSDRNAIAAGKHNPQKPVQSASSASNAQLPSKPMPTHPAVAADKMSEDSLCSEAARFPALRPPMPSPKQPAAEMATKAAPSPTPMTINKQTSAPGPLFPAARTPMAMPMPMPANSRVVASPLPAPAVSPVVVNGNLPFKMPAASKNTGTSAATLPEVMPRSVNFNSGSGNTTPQPLSSNRFAGKQGESAGSVPAPSRIAGDKGGGATQLATVPVGAANMGGRQNANNGVVNPPANSVVGAPSPPTREADFGPYMLALQKRIKQNWFPPRNPESRNIVVTFKIHQNGALSHLRIDRPSGSAVSDKAALDAVEHAAPFAALPSGSPPDVDIQFTFDYNVFGGGKATYRQL